ncbi:Methyl-CpG-binding domain-containing protein 11 [Striga hermonthica]|uniref:Methyl-CpG-binding domain-containing protein 11 n=1 Tax=Striga hermonthica TaxID=68872 RepID=A0A9N7RF69_STRHE|nr:Methyl-CpG-binding domain-containing protein 11 [Striga hermonthica]
MATGELNKPDVVVSIELPAPAGWVKKYTPKKGGTPQRNDIVFISPTGEEIKNKRQLDQYLKSHPGGPAVTEFDWGTGDTPRRSARLSEKSKAPEGPMSSSPKKRRKKLSPQGNDEKSNADAEGETQETKEDADVDMNEAENNEVITTEAIPEKPNTEKVETETETKAVLDEPSAVETQNDTETKNSNANVQKCNEVITKEAIPEKPDTGKVETETETKAVVDDPSAAETQNHSETEKSNANVQKCNDVAPEESSAAEAHNHSNTENFNEDVEKSNDAINKESEAFPKKAPDGKVDCAEPVAEDKNGLKADHESEKPRD